MVYATPDQLAVKLNYANWAAFELARPNTLTEENAEEMLEEASEIINFLIGTFNTDVTDSRFTSYLGKLCIRMVKRMRQIDFGQAKASTIPFFSPNDFLIERERVQLRTIGKTLKHRRQLRVVF